MKNKKIINHLRTYIKSYGRNTGSLLIISAAFILNSCVDFEKSDRIYDPSSTKTNDPAITNVNPAGIARGGVREIRIDGQNLGIKGSDTDWVYIGGVRATIKEIIQTNAIIVYRPQLAQGNYDTPIQINVTAPKAIDTSSNFQYMVESPGAPVGNYGTSFGSNLFLALDFDNQENIYIATSRSVWRNDPSGNTLTQMAGNFSRNPFGSISDCKIGPGPVGVSLYLACGTNTIYRVRADTVQTGTVRPAPVDTLFGNVSKLDFDVNGNIYSGGTGGVFLTNLSSGNTSQSLGYDGTTNIKGLRVIYLGSSGYLYIGDSLNIWRSQINSDGTLGGQEKMVDLAAASGFAGCIINSFDIDENGSIYLCIRNYPGYSLFLVEGTSITPYYYDTDILPSTAELIAWGSSRYLYLISSSLHQAPPNASLYEVGRVFRMNMDKNGAAHQGRNF